MRLLTVVLLVIAVWTFSGSASSQSQHYEGQIQMVRVRSGDTVWTIAGRVAGERDVREVIAAIRALNGLDKNLTIVAGQELRVPIPGGDR